jgi:hypothetical protein
MATELQLYTKLRLFQATQFGLHVMAMLSSLVTYFCAGEDWLKAFIPSLIKHTLFKSGLSDKSPFKKGK